MFLKYNKWSLLWALFILVLCGIPGKDIPEVDIVNFDKIIHSGIFFVLLLLTVRGFSLQTDIKIFYKSPKIMSFIVCVTYGGILELLQDAIFKDRSADVLDFIANSFGCLVGCIFYNTIERRLLVKLIR
jgi:VanZ family protein